MRETNEGFLYPYVDTTACIHCEKCTAVCTTPLNVKNPQRVFAVQSRNSEVLKTSSSGGLFTELCRRFISNGGTVAAATFDEEWGVSHILSDNLAKLSRCRGSKYVQSNPLSALKKLPVLLRDGTPVLFVGTPCQVAAAVRVAGTHRDTLTTVSFVCHGVPSPGVWKRYVAERESLLGAPITAVEMRNKDFGWQSYSMKMTAQNGTVYQAIKRNDPYLRGFLANLYLRSSCHACDCKGEKNIADIVLADCWNAKQLNVPFSLEKGVSLVLLQSEKGKALFSAVQDQLESYPLDDTALEGNHVYTTSVASHPYRRRFFRRFAKQKKSVISLMTESCRPSLCSRLKSRLKRRTQ